MIQEPVMTRVGVDRMLRYAFDLARGRPRRKLISATKSNGIPITMPFWDARMKEMARLYPHVTVEEYHIDILAAHFALNPDRFDVVVGSNLFGDILSDLGPAGTGAIGIAPPQAISIRSAASPPPRCSSRSWDRRPTSPGRISPTRSDSFDWQR